MTQSLLLRPLYAFKEIHPQGKLTCDEEYLIVIFGDDMSAGKYHASLANAEPPAQNAKAVALPGGKHAVVVQTRERDTQSNYDRHNARVERTLAQMNLHVEELPPGENVAILMHNPTPPALHESAQRLQELVSEYEARAAQKAR